MTLNALSSVVMSTLYYWCLERNATNDGAFGVLLLPLLEVFFTTFQFYNNVLWDWQYDMKYSCIRTEYGEYFAEYCQSHITLVCIWIMFCCHLWKFYVILVARLSNHRAIWRGTHALVCVCVCMGGGLGGHNNSLEPLLLLIMERLRRGSQDVDWLENPY